MPAAHRGSSSQTGDVETALSAVASGFEGVLAQMEGDTGRLLTVLEDLRLNLQSARRAQETVYNTFQKVRKFLCCSLVVCHESDLCN